MLDKQLTDYQHGKLEGIKEIGKFVAAECKSLNKQIKEAENRKFGFGYGFSDDIYDLKERLRQAVKLKVSIEKYYKKLKHEYTGE